MSCDLAGPVTSTDSEQDALVHEAFSSQSPVLWVTTLTGVGRSFYPSPSSLIGIKRRRNKPARLLDGQRQQYALKKGTE